MMGRPSIVAATEEGRGSHEPPTIGEVHGSGGIWTFKLEAPKGHPSKGHRWKSKILINSSECLVKFYQFQERPLGKCLLELLNQRGGSWG